MTRFMNGLFSHASVRRHVASTGVFEVVRQAKKKHFSSGGCGPGIPLKSWCAGSILEIMCCAKAEAGVIYVHPLGGTLPAGVNFVAVTQMTWTSCSYLWEKKYNYLHFFSPHPFHVRHASCHNSLSPRELWRNSNKLCEETEGTCSPVEKKNIKITQKKKMWTWHNKSHGKTRNSWRGKGTWIT